MNPADKKEELEARLVMHPVALPPGTPILVWVSERQVLDVRSIVAMVQVTKPPQDIVDVYLTTGQVIEVVGTVAELWELIDEAKDLVLRWYRDQLRRRPGVGI